MREPGRHLPQPEDPVEVLACPVASPEVAFQPAPPARACQQGPRAVPAGGRDAAPADREGDLCSCSRFLRATDFRAANCCSERTCRLPLGYPISSPTQERKSAENRHSPMRTPAGLKRFGFVQATYSPKSHGTPASRWDNAFMRAKMLHNLCCCKSLHHLFQLSPLPPLRFQSRSR
jgi:hypothetical protein